MRVNFKAIVFTLTTLLLVVLPSKANAEVFVAGDVEISWGTIYKKPDSILFADFIFDIKTRSSDLRSVILGITNKYGDKIAICDAIYVVTVPPSTASRCSFAGTIDYSETVLSVAVSTKSNITSIYKTPITFLDRNAKPISQPKESIASNDDLESLKEQIRVLMAKINKICKVKPKPRGC